VEHEPRGIKETASSIPQGPQRVAYTIGHSTRSLEEFLGLLQAQGIELLLDVRTVPRSGRNPQFNSDTLPQVLQSAGIEYRHLAELGGLRKPRPDSANLGWRNSSFRGFADYMQSEAFRAALVSLRQEAERRVICLMCAEALPWRCHRSLIGDALLVQGISVENIFGPGKVVSHRMTPFAKVDGPTVTYPAQPSEGTPAFLDRDSATLGVQANSSRRNPPEQADRHD